MILRLKRQGFTILLVEQNLRFARKVADRHVVVENGKVVDILTAAELDRRHGRGFSPIWEYEARCSNSITPQLLFGQILLGLINGSFYAMLSMGLAIIFGLMNVVNFAHGAQYMLGAFAAWLLLTHLGIPYWGAL